MPVDGKQKIAHNLALFVFVSPEIAWKQPISYLALKLGYINKTHAHMHKVEPKALYFKFYLTITEPFSPIHLEEIKNY